MAAFIADSFSLTTTAAKIVDAAEFDREVIVTDFSASSGQLEAIRIGFTSSDEVHLRASQGGDERLRFTLPCGAELWSRVNSGTGTLHLIVTAK
ncbi:MAG TPA: hypothetical protein VLB29_03480 [Nocardioidaceae bacterium]|nr:hypothetical protein [Nocardioidaceae bacterium]